MARRKKTSAILEIARLRLAGLKQIDVNLDLGPGLKASDYEADITEFSNIEEEVNGALAAVDQVQARYGAKELFVRDKNRRVLSAVEARFGPDSAEYEMVGGTRQSERKRPGRKPGGGSGKDGTGTPSQP
jgi:hypothetical protein